MKEIEIEKARRLLNVLEMKSPKLRIDNLIKLFFINEIKKRGKEIYF